MQHDSDTMQGFESNWTTQGSFKLAELRTDSLFSLAQKLAPVVQAHLDDGSMSRSDPLPQLHEKMIHAGTFASQIPLIAEAHARMRTEHLTADFTGDEIAVHGPVYGFFPPSVQAKLIKDTGNLLVQSPRAAATAIAGLWNGRNDINPAIRSAIIAVVCNPAYESAITDPTAKGIALGGNQSPHLTGLASGLDCMHRHERAATVIALHALVTASRSDPSILDNTVWPPVSAVKMVEALHKGIDSLNGTELAQLREDAPVLDQVVPGLTRQGHQEMAIDRGEEYTPPKSVDAFYSDINPLFSHTSESGTVSAFYQHIDHFDDMEPEVRSAVVEMLEEWQPSDKERKLDVIIHMALKMDHLLPTNHQDLSRASRIWRRPDPDTNGALAVGISKWWEAQKKAYINEASRDRIKVPRSSLANSTKRKLEIDERSGTDDERRRVMFENREGERKRIRQR